MYCVSGPVPVCLFFKLVNSCQTAVQACVLTGICMCGVFFIFIFYGSKITGVCCHIIFESLPFRHWELSVMALPLLVSTEHVCCVYSFKVTVFEDLLSF